VRDLAGWRKLAGILTGCIATVIAGQAQIFTKLADFNGATAIPQNMTLVQATDGNLYGTTTNMELGPGTVFRLSTDGKLSILYNFCSRPMCADGNVPYSGVILGTDGNLYGTTLQGGANRAGTIFRLTLGGALTVLYNFCNLANCIDGGAPFGGVIEGSDDNLYGTTVRGGSFNGGTIYKFTPSGLTTMYSFCSQGSPCPDGAWPEAALSQGFDGSFYGSTFMGGVGPCPNGGTLFKITPSGVFTTLWDFSQCFGGAQPVAPLLELSNSRFYGITTGGPYCCGTIFNTTTSGGFTALYTFCQEKYCSDGRDPGAPLALGSDGNVYGTTILGGGSVNCLSGCGTIFQASLDRLTAVYGFCLLSGCLDGYNPEGGLLQATNGVFYGTASLGGAYGAGTAFSLNMGLDSFVAFVRGHGKAGQISGLLGQGFTGTTGVFFNGVSANYVVMSDTYLTATVPAGGTSGVVTVTTPTGTLTSNVPFRVLPQLLSFTPTSGPVGTQVTITGVSFTQTSGVGFGDYTPAQFTVNSDTQVTATVPAGAQTGPVGIQTQGGIAISTQTFTVTQ